MPWALQSSAISLQDRHDGQGDCQPGIPGRVRNRIQKDSGCSVLGSLNLRLL